MPPHARAVILLTWQPSASGIKSLAIPTRLIAGRRGGWLRAGGRRRWCVRHKARRRCAYPAPDPPAAVPRRPPPRPSCALCLCHMTWTASTPEHDIAASCDARSPCSTLTATLAGRMAPRLVKELRDPLYGDAPLQQSLCLHLHFCRIAHRFHTAHRSVT